MNLKTRLKSLVLALVVSLVAASGEIFQANLAAELKWLPELDTKHRLEGDYVWFKLALAF